MRIGTVSTQRAWLARGFLGAILTWMLMLLMVPWLLASDTGGRAVTTAAAGTYLVGSVICHQRPDRSFRLWGVQMPVCARCAGLYLGAAVGALLGGAGVSMQRLADRFSGARWPSGKASRGITPVVVDPAESDAQRRSLGLPRPDNVREALIWDTEREGHRGITEKWLPALRMIILVAAVPTGVTWLGEAVGWLPFTGGVRAVAAVPLGVAVTWVVSLVIRGELA